MNSTRQIIRWSLPGLVFVLNLLIFHGLWLGFVGHEAPWGYINEATAPALVAVVAGGLPGGFLIYQIYFHNYRPVGPSLLWKISLFRYYRHDRGASVLSKYVDRFGGKYSLLVNLDQKGSTRQTVQEQIHLPKLKRRFFSLARPHGAHLDAGSNPKKHSDSPAWKCRECARAYVKRSDRNWILLQSTIDYCSSAPDKRWIKEEYVTGSDLYHCLGAARVAVWLAMIASLIYDGIIKPWLDTGAPPELSNNLGNYAIALLLVAALGLFEIHILTKSRFQTTRVYHNRVAAALALASRDLKKPAKKASH